MMRDTGFTFTKRNKADDVTVVVQVHWNHGTRKRDVQDVVVESCNEALHRVSVE